MEDFYMNKFNAEAISKKIAPTMNKVQKSKFVNGISAGMMGAMPITLLGAFSALFLNLPNAGYKEFITSVGIASILQTIIMFTTNFLAVIFTICIAGSYAKQYKEDGVITGILALVCFFVVTPVATSAEGVTTIPFQWLGSTGIFTGIFVSILSTKIYIVLKQKGITIKMPESVPPVVSNSFSSLIPGFASMITFMIIAAVFKATSFGSLHQFVYSFLQVPLQGLGGNIVSIIILWTFAQLLWFFGIHGTMVIYSVVFPIFAALDAAQLAAYSAGQALPNITGRAFVSTYTMSGSAIGFALLMLFAAKSKQYKTLGKLSAIPSLFGISEPLVFGTPLVFNFKFFVPFVCLNAVNVTIAYVLTYIGIVPRVIGMTPVTGMPIILSGLMEGSWKIAVLQVLLVGLSVVVWYPFFKKADNEALALEQQTVSQTEA
jgi:PTS system cellobiose-specific IIC component